MSTNFTEKYNNEVNIAINYLLRNNVRYVSVKILRNLYGLKDDRTRINFYWRHLKDLEKEGFISIFRKKHGLYRILNSIPNTPKAKISKDTNTKIDLTDSETCICGASGKSKHRFINIPLEINQKFCSEKCKLKYIYDIQKEREKYDF